MKLKDIAFLGAINNRTRFYLGSLIKHNLLPNSIIIIKQKSKKILPGQHFFDLNDNLLKFLINKNIKFKIIYAKNPNDEVVIQEVKKLKESFIIYSGTGGIILRKPILNLGKKLLHIHPGKLPEYRGSTTIYYQILKEKKCHASALFLNEQIDSGPVLAIKSYPIPEEDIDIDYCYDPKIRADLLVRVIKKYLKYNKFQTIQSDKKEGNTYYVAHPVLRHIAKLKCK